MRKVRKRWKEGKEESQRQRRNHGDAYGIILSGGWRRKETYAGKIVPTYLS
jgi:hypothetical protein